MSLVQKVSYHTINPRNHAPNTENSMQVTARRSFPGLCYFAARLDSKIGYKFYHGDAVYLCFTVITLWKSSCKLKLVIQNWYVGNIPYLASFLLSVFVHVWSVSRYEIDLNKIGFVYFFQLEDVCVHYPDTRSFIIRDNKLL